MFDPPVTRDADKRIRDLWIWVTTIITVMVVLTTTGLLATVANQGARDADRYAVIDQGPSTSHHGAR
jgi:hypothetical protein